MRPPSPKAWIGSRGTPEATGLARGAERPELLWEDVMERSCIPTSTSSPPMPSQYLPEPQPSHQRAPLGEVLLLLCDWLTGNVGVVAVPIDDVGAADVLHDPGHTYAMCRLPNTFSWTAINQLVRHVVMPLMAGVRAGYRSSVGGSTFSPEAETARQLIARAVAAWRAEIER